MQLQKNWGYSSTVESRSSKPSVAGSNPATPAINRKESQRDSFFIKKISRFKIMQWTYPRKIFLSILLLILIGSLLLYTPIAFNYQTYHYENNQYVFHLLPSKNFVYTQNKRILNFNFFNAIFMATSAFTNTGLTLLPIGDDLSFFGQFVIYVLIEIGGFGYASLFYLAAKWLRKITKKGVFSSAILNIEKGGTKITSSPFMIVKIFIIIFIIQLVFGFIFSLIFFFHPFYIQQS